MNWVGRRDPLYLTSSGKVFVAEMDPAALKEYLIEEELRACTPRTITDPVELETQLDTMRRLGYAWTSDEQEFGLAAVAAPVQSLDGSVIAALTVSEPSFRMPENSFVDIAERLLPAAAQISERNGYPKAG